MIVVVVNGLIVVAIVVVKVVVVGTVGMVMMVGVNDDSDASCMRVTGKQQHNRKPI